MLITAAGEVDVWRSFSTYTWMLLDEARQELVSDKSA
jgi:sarcosine oxidase gamma subunit